MNALDYTIGAYVHSMHGATIRLSCHIEGKQWVCEEPYSSTKPGDKDRAIKLCIDRLEAIAATTGARQATSTSTPIDSEKKTGTLPSASEH